nr:hypothetical protein BaRGS_022411 [Batillaria attramentaria]
MADNRAGAGSSRQGGGPARQKTEKELYFEQQQKRLKQFGKPGAQVADADKLIENMFVLLFVCWDLMSMMVVMFVFPDLMSMMMVVMFVFPDLMSMMMVMMFVFPDLMSVMMVVVIVFPDLMSVMMVVVIVFPDLMSVMMVVVIVFPDLMSMMMVVVIVFPDLMSVMMVVMFVFPDLMSVMMVVMFVFPDLMSVMMVVVFVFPDLMSVMMVVVIVFPDLMSVMMVVVMFVFPDLVSMMMVMMIVFPDLVSMMMVMMIVFPDLVSMMMVVMIVFPDLVSMMMVVMIVFPDLVSMMMVVMFVFPDLVSMMMVMMIYLVSMMMVMMIVFPDLMSMMMVMMIVFPDLMSMMMVVVIVFPDLMSVMMGTSLPGWCRDKGDNLPVVYKQVLEAVTDGDKIVIERLYPILLLSGLPRQRLGQLWNMANTHTPGELIRSELWMLLALIALVQNNYEVTSLAILRRCPQAPVPFLGQPPHPVNPGQPPHPVNPGQPPHTGQPSHPIAPGQPSHPIAPDQPSHPVNMGQTPHPANPSQPPQPLTSALGAPVPPSVYPASQTHPSQHPPQNPAAPAVIPGVTMTTAAAPLSTSSNAAAEDDFADFQAAPTPVAKNTTATRTDDSYGQFIGGANTAAKDQSIASVPQAAAEKLETMYTEGMTIEDQYNSNVRNFFCSSDSSTASDPPAHTSTRHTTPNSLDDDDFTDGHDSLSQVSTSEQSENEDIRAFENYVEEFNRKRDAQISNNSPLHCPFPHPNTSGRGDAVFTGGGFSSQEQATVVTVKKKNLGTSDIMGVFKVRDDPATLSSYELPKRVADHQKPADL